MAHQFDPDSGRPEGSREIRALEGFGDSRGLVKGAAPGREGARSAVKESDVG